MKRFTRILALVLALAAITAVMSAETAYTFRTSKEERVVTENGEFTADLIVEPVLITSIGQSADVSMLDALMKKVGATYTFDPIAPAEEVAKYKTVIIASGASSKGLGAAGISQEQETARAEAIMKTVEENEITVILAHLGGPGRRGALSDTFSDMVLAQARYIIMVEEGNDDGKFTDFAAEKEIPITLLATIADAMAVLKDLFAPVAQ
ncbi:MAG: hypothetical protein GX810_03980 [Clostridiales bacterium]|jgi:hypothetical protein|nr:hypothetical protein [Clostridiales bacterium]